MFGAAGYGRLTVSAPFFHGPASLPSSRPPPALFSPSRPFPAHPACPFPCPFPGPPRCSYPSLALDFKDLAAGQRRDAKAAPVLQLRNLGTDLLFVCVHPYVRPKPSVRRPPVAPRRARPLPHDVPARCPTTRPIVVPRRAHVRKRSPTRTDDAVHEELKVGGGLETRKDAVLVVHVLVLLAPLLLVLVLPQVDQLPVQDKVFPLGALVQLAVVNLEDLEL